MKYKIEYEETIKRVKEIIIEVESKEQGDKIANILWDESDMYEKPEDIEKTLGMMNVKILEKNEKQECYKCEVL